jgi:hypothetical protein
MRLSRCLGVIAAVAFVATATAAPSTATTPPAHTVLFAAVDQLGKLQPLTRAAALSTARAVDLISASVNRAQNYAPYGAQMRAANPRLRGIIYIDGSHSWVPDFPESYYAHNASGRRIFDTGYKTYLMNITPGSPWLQYAISEVKAGIRRTHWDGVFFDNEGAAACVGWPVHPGTKTVWTLRDCLEASNRDSRTVQAASGGILLANGLGDGSAFFNAGPSSLLVNGITGGDAESFPAGLALDNVRMLQSWGSVIMTNTKFDPSDQWHRYTLALFALGTNGRDVYFFIGAPWANPDVIDRYEPAARALGTALDSMVQLRSGVYVRLFAYGVAVANPTSQPVTVSFSRWLTNLNGKQVRSETLPPRSGDLLHA